MTRHGTRCIVICLACSIFSRPNKVNILYVSFCFYRQYKIRFIYVLGTNTLFERHIERCLSYFPAAIKHRKTYYIETVVLYLARIYCGNSHTMMFRPTFLHDFLEMFPLYYIQSDM